MNATQILSQRLKHFRKLNNMTQSELAAKIGVEPEHIANIESGRKGISLEKLVLICIHFNINLSDILPIKGHDNSSTKEKWKGEILAAINKLDTDQLCMVKTMVCSLIPD